VTDAGTLATQVVFAIIALVVIASGILMVTRRNPVAAIACLVVHFVATACAYVVLQSQFLGAAQVLVYAGAIMVLFLFVVMLLAVDKQPDPGAASGLGRKALVAACAVVLITVLGRAAAQRGGAGAEAPGSLAPGVEDSIEWLAADLMEHHLVAFELASMVLIAAMAGVLVYTTRRGRELPDGGGAP
jgi:NADH-quinone oxidoreductase subunit J